MKKSLLIVGMSLFLFAGGAGFTSCNSADNKTKTEAKAKTVKATEKETAEYQCPMHCEGDKTYDKPGKCPVCGMNLKEVAMADNHVGHSH